MKLIASCLAALIVCAPFAAAAQQIPKDTCSVASQADLDAVLGAGAKGRAIGDEQCEFEGPGGGYEIHVRRSNGAAELKDWTDLSMVKPVAPVKDIGDEAYVSQNQNVVAFRKGTVAVRVSASGVKPTAPMKYQQGVVELARRIAARIK